MYDINNTCFKDISNLGGNVLFFIFLCKMRYVTDYLQIGLVYNNIPKDK